ncbi:MAG: permease [Deltaproteobacteria bacterium]|nr:permease [Deltaproteobacteria bacterium]
MLALVLGLLALCIGPLLGPLLVRVRPLASALDGFVVVTVCGLVVLHILPQSAALGGAIALPLAGLGLLLPALLHRVDARQATAAVRGSRAFVATALLMSAAFAHALLDGVALTAGGEHGHHHDDESVPLLAIAVILHRVPYALALWLVGRERMGLTRTLLVLGALALGTIAGAFAGDQLVTSSTATGLALVQAFAAGAILHVLLDAPPVDVSNSPGWSFVGVVGGVGLLVLLTRDHPILASTAGELDFTTSFLTLALAAAPALVAALGARALATVVTTRFPAGLASSSGERGGSTLQNAATGVVAGSLRWLCACAVVPLFEQVVRRRASVAAAVAFLVAAPELSFPSVFLSISLLGAPFTLLRVVSAVVLAIVAAVVVGRMAPASEAAEAAVVVVDPANAEEGIKERLLRSFDHTAPWLLAGVVVAALIEPLLSPSVLMAIPRALEVPLYALIGVPVYVCGHGSAPIAAVLLHKGASAGAVVALLLAAPATNLATLGLLSRLLSKRVAIVFAAVIFACASIAGVAVNGLAAGVDVVIPPLHIAATGFSAIELACLCLLIALLISSVARQGVRGFLGQILHPLDDAKGGHLHGPHCGHAEHKAPGFLKKAPVARVKIDFDP